MLPLSVQQHSKKEMEQHYKEVTDALGIYDLSQKYPNEISGGQQQRVAIARALVRKPKILFADEPTGNLDEETSDSIEALLFEINKEQGTTLVIVTHDDALAHKTDRILKLKGGKIVS